MCFCLFLCLGSTTLANKKKWKRKEHRPTESVMSRPRPNTAKHTLPPSRTEASPAAYIFCVTSDEAAQEGKKDEAARGKKDTAKRKLQIAVLQRKKELGYKKERLVACLMQTGKETKTFPFKGRTCGKKTEVDDFLHKEEESA